MKYQIGEVVRFSGTNNEWDEQFAIITASKMQGEDVFGVYNGPLYRTSISGDWWIREQWLEPVNGGMPKSKRESTSDSLSLEQLLAKVRSLDAAFFEQVCQAMEVESQRRDEQRQRKLAEAIVSAMDAFRREFGDDYGFVMKSGVYVTLPEMSDAVKEFYQYLDDIDD